MARRTLVIDLNRCSGCDSCTVACKYENHQPLGTYWNRVLAIGPTGEYPNIEMYWLPTQCQQCENAPCVSVCPTGASHRDPDNNVVMIDKELCIGCEYCIYACPYGARSFNKGEGVVEKCTLCNHLTATSDGIENLNDSFDPDHAVPPCVHNCACGARYYGDLDDPNSAASKAIEMAGGFDSENVHTLTDSAGAKPTCHYILSPSIAQWKEL
ncbi:Tetrathionate reductase subunit B precursor [Coriobacteriaceae bacterium CHKCI002]|nr:Tetrathionate reductase subunit B precursor [Coriobacteriaceae bacterium CHKCI002]